MQPGCGTDFDVEQLSGLTPGPVTIFCLDQEGITACRQVGVGSPVVFAYIVPCVVETFEHIGVFEKRQTVISNARKLETDNILVMVEFEIPYQGYIPVDDSAVFGYHAVAEKLEVGKIYGNVLADRLHVIGEDFFESCVSAEIDMSPAVLERTFFMVLVASDTVLLEIDVDGIGR